jgi:hypothetical protein
MISQNALHWIFLEAGRFKAKDLDKRLSRAIGNYLKKFNGTETRTFLTSEDQSATYADIYEAYIAETVSRYVEYGSRQPGTPKEMRLKQISSMRSVSPVTLKNALLLRGIT